MTAAALVLISAMASARAAEDMAGFDGLRRDSIAAAAAAQRQEQAVAGIAHARYLLGRDLDGRRRGLADSRAEQAQLLGAIELLQRNIEARPPLFGLSPRDRLRRERLIAATVPGLRAEAHALGDEYRRIAALRQEIATKDGALAAARAALAADRARLADLDRRRLDAARKLVAVPAGSATKLTALGHEARDLADLIRRADQPAEGRGKRAGAAADPTRPADAPAFAPPRSVLVPPVPGPVVRPFGAAGDDGTTSEGMRLAAGADAAVVAPFDGRVTYAAPFRDRGVILIIRHGGLYHSLLAGLGRADVMPGEWVVAGEPVGVMPGSPPASPGRQAGEDAAEASGRPLDFELRRDGRPVDPQPWLAAPAEGRDKQTGEQRVRE